MDFNSYVSAWNAEAKVQAARLGFNINLVHNNSADAFRHAYVSAKITRDGLGGHLQARAMGDVFEQNETWFGKQPEAERAMDKYNNAIGEYIGDQARANGWDDDRVAEEIKKAIEQGQLIIRPGQPANLPPVEDLPLENRILPSLNSDGQVPGHTRIAWPGDRKGRDGGSVLVHAYERSDGHVNSHYRAPPGR